jgi:hypothetical protein
MARVPRQTWSQTGLHFRGNTYRAEAPDSTGQELDSGSHCHHSFSMWQQCPDIVVFGMVVRQGLCGVPSFLDSHVGVGLRTLEGSVSWFILRVI